MKAIFITTMYVNACTKEQIEQLKNLLKNSFFDSDEI